MEKFDSSWSEYIEVPLETSLAKKIDNSLETEQRQAFLRRKPSSRSLSNPSKADKVSWPLGQEALKGSLLGKLRMMRAKK